MSKNTYNLWERITFKPEKDESKRKLEVLKARYSEVILSFPNDTHVKITGDIDIVKQIVQRLNGLKVDYVNNLEDLLP